MVLDPYCLSAGSATTNAQVSGTKNLPTLEKWDGDFSMAFMNQRMGRQPKPSMPSIGPADNGM